MTDLLQPSQTGIRKGVVAPGIPIRGGDFDPTSACPWRAPAPNQKRQRRQGPDMHRSNSKVRGRLGPPLSATLKFIFCKNFPAHSTDPWFRTKTAHDALQHRVLTTRAYQHRSNFDFVGVVNIVTS